MNELDIIGRIWSNEVCEDAEKEKCLHIDTIVVDSLTVVCFFFVFVCEFAF